MGTLSVTVAGLLGLLLPWASAQLPGWLPPANKTLWAQRTVYQILTDRLERGDGKTTRCSNFYRYCGGTWKGITRMLPYIQAMGYDAIWFSPIHEQTGGMTWEYPDGWHGYWPRNLWAINQNFGTDQELRDLIDSLHQLNMWAMLDVVPNHSGYSSPGGIAVFNQSAYYHTCDGCQWPNCGYSNANEQQILQCRLSQLPDLDQTVPAVASGLLQWHTSAYKDYQLDGYRVDAARHIHPPWLDDLRTNISIFTIGEYASPINVIAERLKNGALDSSLNFPLYRGVVDAFTGYDVSSYADAMQSLLRFFGPNSTQPGVLSLLGNFLENHDGSRFLCRNQDIRMYQNAYAATFFAPGIPITYYGAELAMMGQRDPLWPLKASHKRYKEEEMYRVIQRIIAVRKSIQIWNLPITILNVTGPYSDKIFAFSRGDGLLVVLNTLRDPPPSRTAIQVWGLKAPSGPLFMKDVLFPNRTTLTVTTTVLNGTSPWTNNTVGVATVYLNNQRWPQIFASAASGVDLSGAGIEPFITYKPPSESDVTQTALICFWTVGLALGLFLNLSLHGFVYKLLQCCLPKKSSDKIQEMLKGSESRPPDAPAPQMVQQATPNSAHPPLSVPAPVKKQSPSKAPAEAEGVHVNGSTTTAHAAPAAAAVASAGVEAAATAPASPPAMVTLDIHRGDSRGQDDVAQPPTPLQAPPTASATGNEEHSPGGEEDQEPAHRVLTFAASGLLPVATATSATEAGVAATAVEASAGTTAGAVTAETQLLKGSAAVGEVEMTVGGGGKDGAGEPGAGGSDSNGGGAESTSGTATPGGSKAQGPGRHKRTPSLFENMEVAMQAAGEGVSAVVNMDGQGVVRDPQQPQDKSPKTSTATSAPALAPLQAPSQSAGGTGSNSQYPPLLGGANDSSPRVPPSPFTVPYKEHHNPLARFQSNLKPLHVMTAQQMMQQSSMVRRSQQLNPVASDQASPSPLARPPVRQLMANNSVMRSIRRSTTSDAESQSGISPGAGAPDKSQDAVFVMAGGLVSPALTKSLGAISPGAAMLTPVPNPLMSTISGQGKVPRLMGHLSLLAVQESREATPAASRLDSGRPTPRAESPTATAQEAAPMAASPKAAMLMPPEAQIIQEGDHLCVTMPADVEEVDIEMIHTLTIPKDMILNVAMEYSIPHLADKGFGDGGHFMFGGLGKVVHMFLIGWPGPVGLCCPLYRKAYNDPDNDTVPSFLPPDTEPTLAFSVTVAKRYEPVEVFTLQEGNVTYFFVQAAIFKNRLKEDIYTFEEEEEMLRWISIMNQSVAAIISTFNIKRVQFHDWHATLSLLYLPQDVMPEVLLILHNAHYNGTFPVPDKDRKVYVYNMFDLDRAVWPAFLEHKGNVDMLNSALTWIREHQGGRGCVAVSKRYAESILQKLDVMWQMRPYGVTGILNALPFTDCLASQIENGDMTIEQALKLKADSKAKFQHKFGLKVGPVGEDPFSGPQLVVFLGRMTHQKGADVIAMAADYFLAKCPQCQLVFVGPICDKTGVEAEEMMKKVVAKYGKQRVYSPPGAYFGGDDKKLLLAAADFCLVPSRFEPCGLVDVEFGWNGSIMVGHNTGGLDKMPGIMFSVESNARAHLAAQLGQAVVKALALNQDTRKEMFEEAMSRRFPTNDMMRAYDQEWDAIHRACAKVRKDESAQQDKGQKETAQEFFSTLWRKHNKKDVKATLQARDYDQGRVLRFIRWLTGKRVGRHEITYYMLLLLQSFCIVPAAAVTGYITFVYLAYTSIMGCEAYWDKSWKYFPEEINSLSVRILLNFGIYTIAAPFWMILAMNMRPRTYIFMTVWLVFGSIMLAHAAMVWTQALLFAIIICSAIAPAGLPLISLNFLGQNLEVAEVGLGYMTLTESTLNLYLCVAAVMAGASINSVPFVITFGFAVLCGFVLLGWFSAPDVLHPAYKRVRLVLRKQWKLLPKIKSFWLTCVVIIAENVALVLTAYQVLLDWDLRALIYMGAAYFGARMLAVVVVYGLMSLRCSQLYVQRFILALATMPGFAIAKQLAVMYAPGLGDVIATATLVEFFFGCRFQLVGLLAFQTLPSRELVAIWQLVTMILSSIIPTIVLIVGFTTQPGYGQHGYGLLIGVTVCEGVRLVAMGFLWKVQPKENLATL